MKYFFLSVFTVFIFLTSHGQENFSYSPAQPTADEKITIHYRKSGELIDKPGDPMFYVVHFFDKATRLVEYPLKKQEDGSYSVTIQAVSSNTNLMCLAFYIDDYFDSNKNNGYFVYLYEDGKVAENAHINVSTAYSNLANMFGLKKDSKRVLACYEKEMEIHPENKEKTYYPYLSLYYRDNSDKKEKATEMIQTQLEKLFKTGLKTDTSMSRVAYLYNVLGLREQASYFLKLREATFIKTPKSDVSVYSAKLQKATTAKDKEALYEEVKALMQKDTAAAKNLKIFLGFLRDDLSTQYIKEKLWGSLEALVAEVEKSSKEDAVRMYPSVVDDLIKDSSNYPLAVEYAQKALDYARSQVKKPTEKPSNMMTKAAWQKRILTRSAIASNTYALALYLNKEYKKALPFAKEAAFKLSEGKRPAFNATYALIAEKVEPITTYKPILESWAKEGKIPNDISAVLKRTYIAEHKSETGFVDYMEDLQQGKIKAMLESLKKQKTNAPAPQFAIQDLDGNTVNSVELKGKVVVLDFWATWCGPCRASFPGMQKVVEKYATDSDVKLFFVNTMEAGSEADIYKRVESYIKQTPYTFHVLMDVVNAVKTKFKINALPTKIVIGKDGNVKFVASGFEGSDDDVLRKVSAMIEMAREK